LYIQIAIGKTDKIEKYFCALCLSVRETGRTSFFALKNWHLEIGGGWYNLVKIEKANFCRRQGAGARGVN
jgi:hypothetical protein